MLQKKRFYPIKLCREKRNFLTAVRPLVLIEHLRLAPDFHKRAAKPIAPSRLKCQFFFSYYKRQLLVHTDENSFYKWIKILTLEITIFFLLPSAKHLPRKAELTWQVSRYL